MPGSKISGAFLHRLRSVLKEYRAATGMHAVLIDSMADVISEKREQWPCKNYYCANREHCREDHKLILTESLRWSGLFVYLCHRDIVLWGIPIIQDEKLTGGILAGFRIFEQYKETAGDLGRVLGIADPSELLMAHEEVTVKSRILFNLLKTKHILNVSYLTKVENRVAIQKEIAEKIIENKAKGDFGTDILLKKQNKLMYSIKFCEVADIRSNLNDVLSEIYLEGVNNITLLKFRMLELFVLISRTMLDTGGTQQIQNYYSLTSTYIRDTEHMNDIFSFSHWLTEILNSFIESVAVNRKRLGRINRAIAYIRQNLDKKLSLAEVAAQIMLSESRFAFLFQQETGISFSEYLNRARIDSAKEMINSGQYTIVEVALKLNFYDQSYFTKIFKKQTGLTPKQYEKRQEMNKPRYTVERLNKIP